MTFCVFLCLCQSFGEDILATLRELEVTLREAVPVERPESPTLSSSLHQECLYYLNTYGTHLALISFYMRHDCMTEAVTYLLNKVRLLSYTFALTEALFRVITLRPSRNLYVSNAWRDVCQIWH